MLLKDVPLIRGELKRKCAILMNESYGCWNLLMNVVATHLRS